MANHEKMDYINSRLTHESPKDGESSADFISRVIKDFEAKKTAERQEHLRSIHSNIKYNDEPCIEYFANDPNYKGPNVCAAEAYARSETNGYIDNADFIKKFSTFPRYKSKQQGAIADEYNGIMPLVRGIHVPVKPYSVTGYRHSELNGWKTVDDFANQFKVGEEYSVPMRQSCSKDFNRTYGDSDFCDYSSEMDVKMIFMPKSKNGSRVDLLDCGYKGHCGEAIYLPGEKFIVLDKRNEEFVSPNRKPGETGRSLYRWVIKMQEK